MHQQSTKTVSYPNVNSAISLLGAQGSCFGYETECGFAFIGALFLVFSGFSEIGRLRGPVPR
jgi:hypothetical protein